jgi:hypothetical protein
MEKAVETTCKLGFMLRDMNQEFCSRFVDKLLLKDKHAKAIGSNTITTRANMGAYIGEGNTHFMKYSLFGYTYILILIVIEEAKKLLPLTVGDHNENILEGILSRPAFYNQINCFPNEMSLIRLASTTRIYFLKFKNDYRIGSFTYLTEWRSYKEEFESSCIQRPQTQDYKIIIDNSNVFCPYDHVGSL